MATHAEGAAENIRLEPDGAWVARLRNEDLNRLDPGLRYALALIERKDWHQVFRRTGIQSTDLRAQLPKDLQRKSEEKNAEYLPLLVEFNWGETGEEDVKKWLSDVGLVVADGFFHAGAPKYATARIKLRADAPYEVYWEGDAPDTAEDRSLPDRIAKILQDPRIVRLELPSVAQAMNEDALDDLGLTPVSRQYYGTSLKGKDVIVGIIDDGCALAHPNFLNKGSGGGPPTSRILYVWDPANAPANHWTAAGNFGGRELTKPAIDNVLADFFKNRVVDEDKVHDALDYRIDELASHGTRVMDIAAGNGDAAMSTEGIAPEADIIFVQLPRVTVQSGGASLDAAILEGVRYIFNRAATENKPVVINISYGGYRGPHDGSSIIEQSIDAELDNANDRAVVVAAGNGFEADCHACGKLQSGGSTILRWIVKPEDPTENILEVWYNESAALTVTLVTPANVALGPVGLNAGPQNLQVGSVVLGMIDHQHCASQKLKRFTLALNPTASTGGGIAPAPAGTWQVQLTHVGNAAAKYDAWIERDVTGRPGGARRLQSHFHPDDAEAKGTLASYATGHRSLAVGAYNTATQQVSRYSACGPTRDGRPKPEALAPAEEDAAGRGILCASSCSALPGRMNGTSAAAPQVAGLIALLLQAAKRKNESLTVARIRKLVCDGARHGTRRPKQLRPNGHNKANPRRKVKQDAVAVWQDLKGDGRVDWPESRDRV